MGGLFQRKQIEGRPMRPGAFPGTAYYHKFVYRMVDLSNTGRGTKITLGRHCKEIAVFADFPVDLYVGETETPFDHVGEIRLVGDFDTIYIKERSGTKWPGRVVIYAGRPYLGVNFQREDLQRRSCRIITQSNVTWAAGIVINSIMSVAIPDGPPAMAKEAVYLKMFDAARDQGTINGAYYTESESGFAYKIWIAYEKNPTDRITRVYDTPIRISTSGAFYLTGSYESVQTNITRQIGLVYV